MEVADIAPELPSRVEVINHNIESALLYAATAGNVACAGLSMAIAVREAVAAPDRDRSYASAVAIAGLAVGAAVTGHFAERLKASVDDFNDRFRDIGS